MKSASAQIKKGSEPTGRMSSVPGGYPLYYYNSNRKGEVDFLIEHQGHVLPLEVKSGKN